jgi:hypothetical protein
MITDGLSRRYINEQVDRINRMLKWGAAELIVPESVYRGVVLVEGLRNGPRQTSSFHRRRKQIMNREACQDRGE